MAAHVGRAADGSPVGVIVAREYVGDGARIGLGRIARPHPDPAVTLERREAAHRGVGGGLNPSPFGPLLAPPPCITSPLSPRHSSLHPDILGSSLPGLHDFP